MRRVCVGGSARGLVCPEENRDARGGGGRVYSLLCTCTTVSDVFLGVSAVMYGIDRDVKLLSCV